jgi:hypothetical protein
MLIRSLRCPRPQAGASARRGVILDPRQRSVDAFGGGRLGHEREGAARQACWRSSSSVMICTGMCRVSGFLLEWLGTVSEHVGQEDVE